MNKEMLMQALSDVGDDLIAMAEEKTFQNPWRKWAQTAAVLAVAVCLGALVLPWFPMGCGSAETEQAPQVTEAPMELYEEAVEECEEACVTQESAAEGSGTEDTADLQQEKLQSAEHITVEQVQEALEEENMQWLAANFALPAEAANCDAPADITVQEAKMTEDGCLYLAVCLPQQENRIKEYYICFEEDSWRYVSAEETVSE